MVQALQKQLNGSGLAKANCFIFAEGRFPLRKQQTCQSFRF